MLCVFIYCKFCPVAVVVVIFFLFFFLFWILIHMHIFQNIIDLLNVSLGSCIKLLNVTVSWCRLKKSLWAQVKKKFLDTEKVQFADIKKLTMQQYSFIAALFGHLNIQRPKTPCICTNQILLYHQSEYSSIYRSIIYQLDNVCISVFVLKQRKQLFRALCS